VTVTLRKRNREGKERWKKIEGDYGRRMREYWREPLSPAGHEKH